MLKHLQQQLAERDAQSLRRHRRVAETACAPRQTVSLHGGKAGAEPRELLTFCSNDYLGLANHPVLIEALAEGARLYGAGSGASHLISGHSRAHALLEDDLAEMLSPHLPEVRALYFCTGYMANLALLSALGDAQATIYTDLLNHASLIDGGRLAKAAVHTYPHSDLAGLERRLALCSTPRRLIVTDGVFSMDGDMARLPELLTLAERHDAWIVVDDAHGFGVLGEQGRGVLSHFGLCSERLICMGTLGKAAGVAGAFVAAHRTIIDWLVQSARAYIYTTAGSPAVAHAVRASLQLIRSAEGDRRRQHLRDLIVALRQGLSTALGDGPGRRGWRLAESQTAIQPLIVGASADALAVAAALEAQGLWVPAIRPPTVPSGSARLRITLSAAHRPDDVQRLLSGLAVAAAETVEGEGAR
ncbi:MAG: 8-amino-7-oxononanoate synthase [Burkholderiaceae bacterium]|nr:8-amino-7-oxononanoate synthase [Burkholderiaceae bacterium]